MIVLGSALTQDQRGQDAAAFPFSQASSDVCYQSPGAEMLALLQAWHTVPRVRERLSVIVACIPHRLLVTVWPLLVVHADPSLWSFIRLTQALRWLSSSGC